MRLAEERRFHGFYHPGRGQEATPAGVCTQLRVDDCLMYAHRGLTYLTAKGMDPVGILGDFLETEAGSTRGLGAGTVHCVDPDRGIYGQGGTLGSCFPIATGAALAFQLRRTDLVAVAFFGDGASARGTFLESAVTAVARKLPVIYICENNGFAISVTPEETQGCASIAGRAEGFGMPTHIVDGTDVVAVHEATAEAVARARLGEGPSFIEATTVRHLGHFAGDLQGYRPDRAVKASDPIERTRAALLEHGVSEAELDGIAAAAAEEMERALRIAEAAPRPGPARLFEGIWS
jgi:acetoin:2,6-dichlorophenolindophenol oxidoreductase subunit alpha